MAMNRFLNYQVFQLISVDNLVMLSSDHIEDVSAFVAGKPSHFLFHSHCKTCILKTPSFADCLEANDDRVLSRSDMRFKYACLESLPFWDRLL